MVDNRLWLSGSNPFDACMMITLWSKVCATCWATSRVTFVGTTNKIASTFFNVSAKSV
ncbi:Uncharacterised protein [Streptococcus pneumoniae]|nr:Uncharacterised protein [Streptococcus pneumoniae]